MKIYGGYMYAEKPGRQVIRPVTLIARSESEAIGKLIQDAKDAFPSADGWGNHNGGAAEVTEKQLKVIGR